MEPQEPVVVITGRAQIGALNILSTTRWWEQGAGRGKPHHLQLTLAANTRPCMECNHGQESHQVLMQHMLAFHQALALVAMELMEAGKATVRWLKPMGK